MALEDNVGGGGLVDFAALHIHDAVFEHVNPADAGRARDFVQRRDEPAERHLLAVQVRRNAFGEGEGDLADLVGGLPGRHEPHPDGLGNLLIQINRAGGDAAAPHGFVVAALDLLVHGDAPRLAQRPLFAARQVEVADRDEDLALRGEHLEDVVHAILVVALAGGAFHEGVAAEFLAAQRHFAGHQLARHRGRDGVAFVVGVGADGLGQPLLGELLRQVYHDGFDAERLGLGLGDGDFLVALADVAGDGNNILDLVGAAQEFNG